MALKLEMTPKARLFEILELMRSRRVLVIGDWINDEYINLQDTGRKSPESPESTIYEVGDRWDVSGGAGAVFKMVGRLACDIAHPHAIFRGLQSTKLRLMVSSGQVGDMKRQLCRIDYPHQPSIHDDIEKVLKRIANEIEGRNLDAIILSDYGLGTVCPKVLKAVGDYKWRCAGDRIPVVVIDPRRTSTSETLEEYALAEPDAMTPNESEFNQWLPVKSEAAGNFIQRRIVVTKGARGATPLERLSGFNRGCAFPRDNPIDVCGAGDQFCATLTLAVAAGATWEEAVDMANLAAGLQVDRLGAVPVRLDELRAEINRLPDDQPKAKVKIVDRDSDPFSLSVEPDKVVGHSEEMRKIGTEAWAEIRIRNWKEQGLKVVVANGCFDMLHPGHVHLLREAAKCGKKLVVAVNSDRSVQEIKGKWRPVYPQSHRVRMVANLPFVDAAFVFDGRAEDMLDRIKPSAIVKGEDARQWVEHFVRRKEVASYLPECVIIPNLQGWHTTSVVERLSTCVQQARS